MAVTSPAELLVRAVPGDMVPHLVLKLMPLKKKAQKHQVSDSDEEICGDSLLSDPQAPGELGAHAGMKPGLGSWSCQDCSGLEAGNCLRTPSSDVTN